MAEKSKNNNFNTKDLKNFINKIIEVTSSGDTQNLYSSPNKDEVRKIKEFLTKAEADMKASMALYKMKDYANSTYHLQQAIEKMVKALALKFFPLKYHSIINTRHNSPEIYLILFKEPSLNSLLRHLQSLNMFVSLDFAKLGIIDETISNSRKNEFKSSIAKLSSSEISALLDFSNFFIQQWNMTDSSQILRSFYGNDFETSIKEISKDLTSDYPEIESQFENVDWKGILYGTIKDIDKSLINLILISIPLYILSIITYPHEAFTRYPSEQCEQIGHEDYNTELGIVQEYERIWEASDIILKRLNL